GPHPFAAPVRYHTSADSLARGWGGMWTSIARAFGRTIASWDARDPAHLARRLQAARGPMPALFIDVGAQDGRVGQSRAFRAEPLEELPQAVREERGYEHEMRHGDQHREQPDAPPFPEARDRPAHAVLTVELVDRDAAARWLPVIAAEQERLDARGLG